MRLKIGTKISLGFALILVLVCVVGGNSYLSLQESKRNLDEMDAANQRLLLGMQIENNFLDGVAAMRGFMFFGDEIYCTQAEDALNKTLEAENQLLQIVGEDVKPVVKNLIMATSQFNAGVLNDLVPVVRSYHTEHQTGNTEQVNALFERMHIIAFGLAPFTDQLSETIDKIVADNKAIVDSSFEASEQQADNIVAVSQAMTVAALIIGIVLSVFFTRMIRNPILKMVSGANNYAQGDFTNPIEVNTSDEIGELTGALNTMQNSFKDVIQKLAYSSGSLTDSAQQLAAQSQQTSAGAAETASTMNEIATTVDNMSQNTQHVSQQAEKATQHADKGFQGIELVTGQMQEISSSTTQVGASIDSLNTAINKIGQFVEVITNIADQTNLLALNAAIEAARAGDAGRGFAVVAEEVRTLAEQSAQSTQEIKQLIEEIQDQSNQAVKATALGGEKVEQGNKVVREVGENFAEIIGAVQELTDQIQNVAAAAQQVSAGVQNVAGTTEEQTAAMEEVSAATEGLNKLADELNTLVLKFKI